MVFGKEVSQKSDFSAKYTRIFAIIIAFFKKYVKYIYRM